MFTNGHRREDCLETGLQGPERTERHVYIHE